MSKDCPSTTRPLYDWEITEARLIFENQLRYSQVRIHECTAWPDYVYRISMKLRRQPAAAHNAATLGNHCFFPIPLCKQLAAPGDPEFYKIPWLIHELTHVWQYQHLGWVYLFTAVQTHIRQGMAAYHFGGEEGLRQRGQSGDRFQDFNLEQQGDIASSYYDRLKRGEDTSAWKSYVADVQEPYLPIERS